MQVLQVLSIVLAITCFGSELNAEEIDWGQSGNAGKTSNANKPNIDYKLPGVSNKLFDTSSSKPKMICLGGRWIETSPYGSTDSKNAQWHCVGGVLTPDPRHSSENLQ